MNPGASGAPQLATADLIPFIWDTLNLLVYLLQESARVEGRYGVGLQNIGQAFGPTALLRVAQESGPAKLGRLVQFMAELQGITTRAPDLNLLSPDEKLRVATELKDLMKRFSDIRGESGQAAEDG